MIVFLPLPPPPKKKQLEIYTIDNINIIEKDNFMHSIDLIM